MKKEIIKSLIALKQQAIPFGVITREMQLPLHRKKIITIPGVRRCGKSTMMEIAINQLIESGVSREQVLWLGFDDERLRTMTADELNQVIEAYMEMFPEIPIGDVYMFFDEIQLITDWEYFVLRVYKSYCKNIYVCGSNATMLSTEVASALRGYPLEYRTYPLSFGEYCRFKEIPTQSFLEQDKARQRMAFDTYISESAFPEIVLTTDKTDQIKLLQGYFDTLVLKDLVEHYRISNIAVVRYFIKRLMNNLTKPTSILSIYKDIKSQGLRVSKDDLYLWANYVCDIFLFFRISRYDRSLVREQSSLDKCYCIDNGLRAAVLLPQSNDLGKRLENTVFLHLQRNLLPGEKITYFAGDYECDFVVQHEERVVQLIQVCWDMHNDDTRKRELRGLQEAAATTGCTNLLLITHDEEEQLLLDNKQIEIIPAWKWITTRTNK